MPHCRRGNPHPALSQRERVQRGRRRTLTLPSPSGEGSLAPGGDQAGDGGEHRSRGEPAHDIEAVIRRHYAPFWSWVTLIAVLAVGLLTLTCISLLWRRSCGLAGCARSNGPLERHRRRRG